MSHETPKLWLRGEIERRLDTIDRDITEIDKTLDEMNRLNGSKRVPARLRRKLQTTRGKVAEARSDLDNWLITEREKLRNLAESHNVVKSDTSNENTRQRQKKPRKPRQKQRKSNLKKGQKGKKSLK